MKVENYLTDHQACLAHQELRREHPSICRRDCWDVETALAEPVDRFLEERGHKTNSLVEATDERRLVVAAEQAVAPSAEHLPVAQQAEVLLVAALLAVALLVAAPLAQAETVNQRNH